MSTESSGDTADLKSVVTDSTLWFGNAKELHVDATIAVDRVGSKTPKQSKI